MKKVMTLAYIVEGERILLAMKKRGFGEGLYNGYGGKVEEGESIEDAAKREVEEECTLCVENIEKRGTFSFSFTDSDKEPEVHIFLITKYRGTPQETNEMKPEWFLKNELPFEKMWPGDLVWFPAFLDGKVFEGKCHYDENKNILHKEIRILE